MKPRIPAMQSPARVGLVAARVVDVTDAARFPNIRLALDYVASLSPERRAMLEGEWK